MIRTCMEMTIKDAPPFFCSPALVDTWAQHDDDSVAMPVLLRDKLIEDYQQTGVSKLNKENYMDVLNTYRDDVLHNYMRGLIQQYGRDPTVVAEHVRHPSLTHELIARYPAPRNLELDHGKETSRPRNQNHLQSAQARDQRHVFGGRAYNWYAGAYHGISLSSQSPKTLSN